MNPVLTVYCPSLSWRPFVDQATLHRIRRLPIEFLMLTDSDWRSTGRKTRELIEMSRSQFVMGMGDDDFLHPAIFDYILPLLRPELDMIGFNICCQREVVSEDLICKVHPKFTKELEAWDGITQLRPYAMPCPINKRMLEGITWPDDKSWSEDNEIIKQVTPKFVVTEYIDKVLYYARPLTVNMDRKDWSGRYDSR
jgi:hypothetical protein